jgi:hypothetical protein
MYDDDTPAHDDTDRPVTAAELVALGADPDAVERLPVRHTSGGEPYWPLGEALDLLALMVGGGSL